MIIANLARTTSFFSFFRADRSIPGYFAEISRNTETHAANADKWLSSPGLLPLVTRMTGASVPGSSSNPQELPAQNPDFPEPPADDPARDLPDVEDPPRQIPMNPPTGTINA